MHETDSGVPLKEFRFYRIMDPLVIHASSGPALLRLSNLGKNSAVGNAARFVLFRSTHPDPIDKPQSANGRA
jgi:hypothetical protein